MRENKHGNLLEARENKRGNLLEARENKRGNLLEARENASDQVGIGFCFASDWLRGWRELSKPITERSQAKQDYENSSIWCQDLPASPLYKPALYPAILINYLVQGDVRVASLQEKLSY